MTSSRPRSSSLRSVTDARLTPCDETTQSVVLLCFTVSKKGRPVRRLLRCHKSCLSKVPSHDGKFSYRNTARHNLMKTEMRVVISKSLPPVYTTPHGAPPRSWRDLTRAKKFAHAKSFGLRGGERRCTFDDVWELLNTLNGI